MSPKQMVKDQNGLKGALQAMGGDGKEERRVGFLGGVNATRKPDYVPEREVLSIEETERKNVITQLLLQWIVPNELSSRSKPELDRKSLASKLHKTNLAGLMQFLPAWFSGVPTEKLQAYLDGEEALSDEDKAEIQDRYKDISP